VTVANPIASYLAHHDWLFNAIGLNFVEPRPNCISNSSYVLRLYFLCTGLKIYKAHRRGLEFSGVRSSYWTLFNRSTKKSLSSSLLLKNHARNQITMYISQALLLLSAVATNVVAQRPGEWCMKDVWGCGQANGMEYVGMCNSRYTWTIYDYCDANSICESTRGERPRCVKKNPDPRYLLPGDYCNSDIWGCGTTRDNRPFVGRCSLDSKTWIIYEYCDNGRQECYADPSLEHPQCVSFSKKE
jgi:hypothetical protein